MIKFKDILTESIDYRNHPDIKLLMKATGGENLRNSSGEYSLETPAVDSYFTDDVNHLRKIINTVNSQTSELQFVLGNTNDYESDDDRSWNSSFSFTIQNKD